MSLTDWWLGARSSTSQKVCVRCDANDTVIVNGSTQTAATTTEDGTLVFDGAIGGGSITVNGSVVASYPATSLPTVNFEVAFGSCQTPQHDMMYGHTLDNHNICAFFHSGDFIYETNDEGTKYGGDFASIVSMETDAGVDNMYLQRRVIHQLPGFKKIARKTPMYLIADDHDWCDPWDNTDPGTTVSATGVVIDWMVANESLSRAESLTALTSRIVSANNAYIWRGCPDPVNRYYSTVIGNTKFIVLDCMSNRSAIGATDNSSKTMLGATQKAWLKTELLTDETFKVIVSSKTPSFWSNPDSWGSSGAGVYGTELIEIVKYIGDNSVTGCIWIGGDHHHQSAIKYAAGELQASPAVPVSGYEHIAINSSPVARQQDHDIPWTGATAGLPTGCAWRYDFYGGTGTHNDSDSSFGKLVVNSEYLEMQIWRTNNKMLWAGRIYAGETVLKPAAEYRKVAI
jgi:hypothetical protein